MTLLYYDPIYLEHDTGGHPEKADRLRCIVKHLAGTGLDRAVRRLPSDRFRPSGSRGSMIRSTLRKSATLRRITVGTWKLTRSSAADRTTPPAWPPAPFATRSSVSFPGEERRALCLVRPPGHHALADRAMGFCLFNNAAIAARVATCELDLDRVLIVDWDVHHGNGTQDTFWEDEQVGFYSIHRWPFYPGTGSPHETGGGSAVGTKHNLPVIFGTSRLKYLSDFTSHLQSFVDKIRPQLIIVSAGFDTHRLDPIGSLGLEVEDFSTLTRRILEVAAAHAAGRVVSVLEGGYNTEVLPLCVAAHLTTLLDG